MAKARGVGLAIFGATFRKSFVRRQIVRRRAENSRNRMSTGRCIWLPKSRGARSPDDCASCAWASCVTQGRPDARAPGRTWQRKGAGASATSWMARFWRRLRDSDGFWRAGGRVAVRGVGVLTNATVRRTVAHSNGQPAHTQLGGCRRPSSSGQRKGEVAGTCRGDDDTKLVEQQAPKDSVTTTHVYDLLGDLIFDDRLFDLYDGNWSVDHGL